MKQLTRSLSMLLLVVSLNSSAAPVYLSCTLHFAGKEVHWDLALDEQGGRITMAADSVPPFVEPARFWVDKVQWGVNDAYTISRTDLSLTYVISPGKVERGQCKLKEEPRRKF